MKTKSTLIAALFALLLACGLTACGPSAAEKYGPNFAGSWDLISAKGSDAAVDQETFALLKDHNLSSSLVLNEDGTYVFDVFGDKIEGTWEATAEDTATMEMSGQAANLVLADGKITIDQGTGASLVFAKAGTLAAASSEASSSAASSDSDEAAADAESSDEAEAEEDAEENADATSSEAA